MTGIGLEFAVHILTKSDKSSKGQTKWECEAAKWHWIISKRSCFHGCEQELYPAAATFSTMVCWWFLETVLFSDLCVCVCVFFCKKKMRSFLIDENDWNTEPKAEPEDERLQVYRRKQTPEGETKMEPQSTCCSLNFLVFSWRCFKITLIEKLPCWNFKWILFYFCNVANCVGWY